MSTRSAPKAAPLPPGPVASSPVFDGWTIGVQSLGGVATDLLAKLAPTKSDLKTAATCLTELVKLSQELGPGWSARPFGSLASGFHTRFSDLDVTCFSDGDDASPKSHASSVLARFLPLVQKSESFEITEVISSARIPIMKLRFAEKLDVDLSFQNTDPFPNTQLLKAYAKLSPLVRQLVTLVKLWAKAEGVSGAPNGHLSSYSFTLMAIYFMQVDPLVKMPCFPASLFDGNKRLPETIKVHWQCPLVLPVLIARFFEFYATQYSWGYEVVSVRVGQRLYTTEPSYSQLPVNSDGTAMPHIEDPFLLARNLNCVLGWEQTSSLQHKFCMTLRAIQMGSAPFGFVTALGWFEKPGDEVEEHSEEEQNKTQTRQNGMPMQSDNPQSGTAPRQSIASRSKETMVKNTKPSPVAQVRNAKPPAPEDLPMTTLCTQMTWSL
jgi:hypothetical protein